jgi:hypothetical protein
MGKREPQTILKTDERSIHLKLGRERKFNRQIKLGKTGFHLRATAGCSPTCRRGRGRRSSRYGTISIPSR